jgi:hypothetical protein
VDYSQYPYHQTTEKIIDCLSVMTQVTDRQFFRNMVAFTFAQVAASMRANFVSIEGSIPVNLYVINLAPSGFSKNKSLNILRQHVLEGFYTRFMQDTFPTIAEAAIFKMATDNAVRNNTEQEAELKKLTTSLVCNPLFSFDSGTTAGYKQLRRYYAAVKAGSLNFVMDELASNLTSNADLLNTCLETYDIGVIGDKLLLSTKENTRVQEVRGRVPSNALMFGEPTKLFNDPKIESDFDSLLSTGYARRCVFGYSSIDTSSVLLSAEEQYALLEKSNHFHVLTNINDTLTELADPLYFNKDIICPKDIHIELIRYRNYCTERAANIPRFDSSQQSEMLNRFFKVMKLAGIYTFIDKEDEITLDTLYAAIRCIEDSGDAFKRMMTREKPYVKLGKYFADSDNKVSQVDLIELGLLRGNEKQRSEMLALASAWGYNNNVTIIKEFIDGIPFYRGETLKQNNLDNMIFATSTKMATDFNTPTRVFTWADMSKLFLTNGRQWTNHKIIEGNRSEKNCIPGANMIVIDIDEGTSIELVQLLLSEYEFMLYTTKRHTDTQHRFRMIFPLSHTIKLNAEEFTQFMQNFCAWIPFTVDNLTHQRSRKWASNNGKFIHNKGELIDVFKFIPSTTKAEDFKKTNSAIGNYDQLENWFVNNTGVGNRSNQLLRYALALVDNNCSLDEVRERVHTFNAKLPNKLSSDEIASTIMHTVEKRIINKAQQ